MKVQKDFEEFLELLNRNNVRYLIIGAYALAFHAKPRYTGDLDIFIDQKSDNVHLILKALKEFGMDYIDLTEYDLLSPYAVIQLGFPPNRIDILTHIDGVPFKEAWNKRVTGTFGRLYVPFIGKEELIKNKKAVNRPQDRADLEVLTSSSDLKG